LAPSAKDEIFSILDIYLFLPTSTVHVPTHGACRNSDIYEKIFEQKVVEATKPISKKKKRGKNTI
jgi:hypothetical protein